MTWTSLKGFAPFLPVTAFLFVLGQLKRKFGNPLPAASSCAACGTANPGMRVPNSLNQALWGGWTCAGCGATVNARGEPIPDAPPRPPSRPIGGLIRRRPGLLAGLSWGLTMWLVMSLGPQVLPLPQGGTFGIGKVLLGLLMWGGLGSLFFGSAMRLVLFRKPKA